ncbi:MAG: fructose-bisphosphate aldolase [Candidatus Woesearchaeota archaeon]
MVRINVHKIFRNKHTMLLACDQGLEHGPSDFNAQNIDPEYIFNIALEANYSGVIFQHGIAEKYHGEHYREVPLIVKLNGKSNLSNVPPLSHLLCSVERAIKLGASAVGYTIYPGSPEEQTMLVELSKIVDKAHDYGLPVIVWNYPRGPGINEMDTNTIAYGARMALEMGADVIKLKYNGDAEGFKWITKCAGRARVIISGGDHTDHRTLLTHAFDSIQSGGRGIAVGRNVWQDPMPFSVSKALEQVIFHNKTVDEAMQFLNENK